MFIGRIKATRRKWILWNVSYDGCSQVVKAIGLTNFATIEVRQRLILRIIERAKHTL
jgi:hypothetical protein